MDKQMQTDETLSSPNILYVPDRRGTYAAPDYHSRTNGGKENHIREHSHTRNEDRWNHNHHQARNSKEDWFRGRSSSMDHRSFHRPSQRVDMAPNGFHDYTMALPVAYAVPAFENAVMAAPYSDGLKHLDDQLRDLYSDHLLSEISYNLRLAIHQKLQGMLRERFPTSGLYIIGSTVTGLGAASADMDLCWMISENEFLSQTEAIQYLGAALDIINKEGSFVKDVQLIHARVPILRFVCQESGVQCEINVNNPTAIRNTFLLCHYATIDPRVRALSIAVKVWAQHHEICSAWKGGLSSYSWELLIINYLQICDPPVVPCLQERWPEKFGPKSCIRHSVYNPQYDRSPIDYKSQNLDCLASLFMGFFRFNLVASVREGTVFDVESLGWNAPSRNGGPQRRWINIEEPFDLSNTARGVATEEHFMKILRALRETHFKLTSTFDLSKVLRFAVKE